MKNIIVSAPGKLMLFGEHAVVHGRPCLVTAVNQRMYARVELLDEEEFQLNAKDVKVENYNKGISQLGKGEIADGAKFVEIAVRNLFEDFKIKKGVKVTTSSDFSPLFGFGSSSAITVCIIKALSELLHIKLNDKSLFDLSYQTILDIQGKGSGFDVASAIMGGTLYFETGGKFIQPLTASNLQLIVAYSGIKADTTSLINYVDSKFSNNKKRLQEIYDEIEVIVKKAKREIEKANWKMVGELMNNNQILLSELGVSVEIIENMISAALNAGALGAKMSGAGGGDCIIAIAPESHIKSVEEALAKVGGEIINVQANAEGVRIEKSIL